MSVYVILSLLKKSKPRFYPGINIWILGEYDEFGEYLASDTSKKSIESFFERILCLKMPVHASDIFYLKNDNRTFLPLHYKDKSCIFTYLLFKLKALIYI